MNVTRIIPVLGVIDALMGLDDACFTLPTFRTLRIEERAKCPSALQRSRPTAACTGSTAKRAKCHFALQTSRPTATLPEGTAKRAKCHILPEQQPEKAIQASSGKNSTEEYACEVPQRGG